MLAKNCVQIACKSTRRRLAAGLCPDPLGELTHSPDPLAAMRGPTSKGKEWEGRGREGKGSEWKGSGRGKASETKKFAPPGINFWLRHCYQLAVTCSAGTPV